MAARICSLIALLLVPAALSAQDVVFTMDGNDYTLHEDGRWSCKGANCPVELSEPMVVTLDSNEIVMDGSFRWHIKEEGELVGTGDIKIKKASATSTSTSTRIDVADTQARKSVVKKIAVKIDKGAPKRNVDVRKILFCMDHLRIVPDTKERQITGKGWEVTASISIDRQKILEIIDCAENVVEDTGDDGGEE